MTHSSLSQITERIIKRSTTSRRRYLEHIAQAKTTKPARAAISCSNLAHTLAAEDSHNKDLLAKSSAINLGIISAYNDMLSAHQPYKTYPDNIKKIARSYGAAAQVASGVPAMCDGITQGTDSMELSLFSRDAIALATAVGLSHNVFDGIIYLGICDKIVPGLLIAALRFGHLPAIFVPSGPMHSNISNAKKAKVRQAFAEGKATQQDLLNIEIAAYHSPGTCTFYGTANSNQMLLECMGLQLPGSSFVAPNSALRTHLTEAAVQQIIAISNQNSKITISDIVNEKTIINAIVGLLATGGSTNHAIHLVAIAQAAGVIINWQDFADLAKIVPLMARVYPNGSADVNAFNNAGGINYIIGQLIDAELMHKDLMTITSEPISTYNQQPKLIDNALHWQQTKNSNTDIVRSYNTAFQPNGGLQLLKGNLGQAIIKISAVTPEHRKITAPAKVFVSQQEFMNSFRQGQLEMDHIAVLRYQGPKANGMPELHKLTPLLAVLQDKGFDVGLITDGRMSGASGKVPAAIHLTPEAAQGGLIAKIIDGDMLTLDSDAGSLHVAVDEQTLSERTAEQPTQTNEQGCGRELFSLFRNNASQATEGATIFDFIDKKYE